MTPLFPIRLILQAEGLGLAAACLLAFHTLGGSWILFAVLILLPDLFMLAYLAGPRAGAVGYNLGHTYLVPLGIGGLGLWTSSDMAQQIALIWGVHIGADRAIGYGLKYASAFKATHLARV